MAVAIRRKQRENQKLP